MKGQSLVGPDLIHLWHENQAECGGGAEHDERGDDDEARVLLLIKDRLKRECRL